jgi:hypothetical protein
LKIRKKEKPLESSIIYLQFDMEFTKMNGQLKKNQFDSKKEKNLEGSTTNL